MGSVVGTGLFKLLFFLLRCLARKPIGKLGDWGPGLPESDLAKRELVVSTLGTVS